ncbi:ATP-dependent RNA helicase MRH4, mitochondrial [Blastomyces parvus]|uniref:RNA helicase n=1 Tax=Blastomyces parvus TaxID=2060905 RepID=A0A2B7XBA7_9EURO|nr:ATP-dependent RNA helicase MRH4, mitochondrial [Blastomyces parvus]
MSFVSSVCPRCDMRAVFWGRQPAVSPPWQAVRFASSARQVRRKPARMALSPNVARSADRSADSKKRAPPTFKNNPFGGMNQTRARIPDRPGARSDAQLKRSSSDRNSKEKDDADKKKEGSLFRALKMQIALSPIPYALRNRIKSKIAPITSFDQFDLLPEVRDAVYANAFPTLTEISPTPIQRVAIPALLKPTTHKSEKNKKPKKLEFEKEEEEELFDFDQFLLAAETGTGKTLAYLLPVVNWIKRAETVEKETEMMEKEKKQEEEKEKENENIFELEAPKVATPEHSNVARPRAIILVPTAELVDQVGKLTKQLSHTAKYRSAMISAAYTPRRITNNLFNPAGIDILVSTPHLLTSIAKTNPYILSRVTHLVIDEADSLLDKSFSPLTYSILEKTAPSLERLILASATIPRSLDSILEKKFPEMKRLVTPNLHAIPRRVQLGVVDVDKDPYRGNKKLACADIIWSLGKAGATQDEVHDDGYPTSLFPEPKHIIVFVNERETTEEVTAFLKEKGIHAVALSRDTPDQRKDEILAEFTHVKPLPTLEEVKDAHRNKRNWFNDSVPFVRDQNAHLGPQRNLRDTKVLVTTDLGSRGIDTVAVRNVVLYDVPHTTIDFIHRLGRTGRMGRRGRGIVLVGKKDRKDVVKEVREAMFRGQALI